MNDQRPEVATTAGRVRGVQREGSTAFLGIPFAEPPVGPLRFAAPVAHRAWTGVRDASAHGATPQRRGIQEVTLIPEPSIPGESTLNVDVYTPAPGDEDAGLPVLVYIHGGGFVSGSPASPWYDGTAFNRDGVVTVSVSYRLGFEGFGWISDAPLNRAMLDWILALEWVRDNIRSFGGDPGRVTIAGQSAGGAAVFALLACPRAQGLFHRAISLSGPIADVALERAEAVGRRVAELGGVEPTVAGLSTIVPDRLLELQNRAGAIGVGPDDADDPFAMLSTMTSGEGLPWAPVVDGDLLPTGIGEGVASDFARSKPLLFGTTDNEFNMAIAPMADDLAAVDPLGVLGGLGLPADAARAYVDAHSGAPTAVVLGQFLTDAVFRAPTRRLAEERAAADAPTWLFRFSWASPVTGDALHCLDVPFFFDCLDAERIEALTGPNPPRSLATDVHGAAIGFIRDGDPGWPRYAVPERAVRVFDTPSSVQPDAFADVGSLRETAAA